MPAYFRIVENPNPNKDEASSWHARFSANGTLTIEDLMEQITYGTTYTEADVDGLLSLLKRLIIYATESGYNLNLRGIGTLMPDVESPAGTK